MHFLKGAIPISGGLTDAMHPLCLQHTLLQTFCPNLLRLARTTPGARSQVNSSFPRCTIMGNDKLAHNNRTHLCCVWHSALSLGHIAIYAVAFEGYDTSKNFTPRRTVYP
jgi:hypothetical protein